MLQEPENWYQALQILVDVLRSETGVPGAANEASAVSSLKHTAFSSTGQPVALLVGNPSADLFSTDVSDHADGERR